MKTKNILLSVFALALISTPLLAQELGSYDYHEFEHKHKIGTSLKQIHQDTVNKAKYLDLGTLSNYLLEDLPIDLEKLLTKATNSINDNKITQQEQYTLMLYCVEHNEKDVLETLLKAGFDPKLNAAGTISLTHPIFDKAIELGYIDIAELLLTYISNSHVEKVKFHLTKEKIKEYKEQAADIVAAYYYTPSGMLVIKQWKNPISEQEFQTWLENNESIRMTNNAAMRQSIDNEIKHQINLFKKTQMNSPFVPGNSKLNFKPKPIDTLK